MQPSKKRKLETSSPSARPIDQQPPKKKMRTSQTPAQGKTPFAFASWRMSAALKTPIAEKKSKRQSRKKSTNLELAVVPLPSLSSSSHSNSSSYVPANPVSQPNHSKSNISQSNRSQSTPASVPNTSSTILQTSAPRPVSRLIHYSPHVCTLTHTQCTSDQRNEG